MSSDLVYQRRGMCPICDAEVDFTAQYDWYRDHLKCSSCGSIPRERAIARVLDMRYPDWRTAKIHESSPGGRGVSVKMRQQCRGYVATQYFPGQPLGVTHRGFRNENLERQTFPDERFDLVISQDVMEHVGQPDLVCQEVARTLAPGGAYIFTAPTYKERVDSIRRARYLEDGTAEHLIEPPEYHGNPVSSEGALVTFHYGYDLPELMFAWSGLHVDVIRFHDHRHGIIGEKTEVYVGTKYE